MIPQLTLPLLLLVAANPLLGAPSDDQIAREALREKCSMIGKLDDRLHLPTSDVSRLRQHVWPEIVDCKPFVVIDVIKKQAQLSDKTRAAFYDFLDHIKAGKQTGASQEWCLIQASASIVPKLMVDQARPSSSHLNEADISASMGDFCGDVTSTFGDLVSFYSVASAMAAPEEADFMPPSAIDTLYGAKLCRLYQQGLVQPLDIMLSILETGASKEARKLHWNEVAASARELFSQLIEENTPSPGETSRLIEKLHETLLLDELEKENADFQLTISKLDQLRDAARVTVGRCVVNKLVALTDLIEQYADSKHQRIELYLLDQYRKQVEFCEDDDSDDVISLKEKVARLKESLEFQSSLVGSMRSKLKAKDQDFDRLQSEFELLECAGDEKLSKMMEEASDRFAEEVKQAEERGQQCMMQRLSRWQRNAKENLSSRLMMQSNFL